MTRKNIVKKGINAAILIMLIGILALMQEPFIYGEKLNTTYMYYGNPGESVESVEDTKGSVSIVYPSYFDLNEDGSLKITNMLDKDFIEEMHKRNIKVVPFLSNHWDRSLGRKALSNRENLAEEIVKAINEYNLDGVNVDIENVDHLDTKDYTDFVKILRKKLPSHKEVSVAVAANPKGWKTGWQASYDYKELGKYSDYLFVMTYDESYQGSDPGPVASISFVEKSIQYALKYVPAEKIVLGIPFYGRYWKEGDAIGGKGTSLKKIEDVITKYNGRVYFDKTSKSPMATVNTPQGTYIYWYENEESIKEKLKLVQKYDLRGSGSWSLGQEVQSIWDKYSLWLNGRYFLDTQNHWAEDAILSMDEKGWMKGISASYFKPDNALTRAQAAVILVRALELENENIDSHSFDDVSSSYWASKEIGIAKKYGLMQGKGFNLFYPEEKITREEMAAMLNRIFTKEEEKQEENIFFKDVNPKDWSYTSILVMNQKGILKGYEDGNFYPKKELSRGQMAALMDRISIHLEDVQK